jgi:hypothetical protein
MAVGGAGLDGNVQYVASEAEVIDGLVPPPTCKKVSSARS